MATAEICAVAATSGSTPNCGGSNSGVHTVPVRKARAGTARKNSSVSNSRTAIMPRVVRIEITAQANSPAPIRFSRRSRAAPRRRRASCVAGGGDSIPREASVINICSEIGWHRPARDRSPWAGRFTSLHCGQALLSVICEPGQTLVVLGLFHSHVAHAIHVLGGVAQVELDELEHLRPRQRGLLDIDKQL